MTAFFLMLMAVCAAVELYSLKHSLDGIEYDCRLSKGVIEPDEETELLSIVTNRKRRFVPFLRLSENVPGAFTCSTELEIGSATTHRSRLKSTVYVMPRQRLTRRTPFTISQRGRYLFFGAELGGGDFLGLNVRGRDVELMRELVVLPRRLDSDVLTQLPGGLMGEKSVNRFIHEDPTMILGYREYTGREPMKRISWTQTARMGTLMVKNQDHTIERSATVVLNLHTFAFGKYGDEMIEKQFSLARGVCETLEEMRVPYSFYTNARVPGEGDATGETGDGLGMAHIGPILEGMGRATGTWDDSFQTLIDRAAVTADVGRTFLVLTPVDSDLNNVDLSRMEARTGLRPRVIVAAEVAV